MMGAVGGRRDAVGAGGPEPGPEPTSQGFAPLPRGIVRVGGNLAAPFPSFPGQMALGGQVEGNQED